MIWFCGTGQNNDANMENDGSIGRFINVIEEEKTFFLLDITSLGMKDQISLSVQLGKVILPKVSCIFEAGKVTAPSSSRATARPCR